MSYASLMVQVDAHGELDGRVRVAAHLAGRFQSRLIGISAWMPRPPFIVEGLVIDPGPDAEEVASRNRLLKERGEAFRTAATSAAGIDGGRVEWRCSLAFPSAYIAEEARAADLVIISRERATLDPYLFPDPGELLLRVGRPVLTVPPEVGALAGERVVVAWKDTREARRAIVDAMPFLQLASTVILVEFCDRSDEISRSEARLRDVTRFLADHGVTAVADRVRPAGDGALDGLLRLVEGESADLIVAGAYGHSRLGEWMFGGMTQGLLAASPVCCLFSH